MVRGAVTAASKIERLNGTFPQPPDVWWPEDRRWFVGGDTDLDWCYIAGSGRLASAVGAELRGRTRAVDWEASNSAAGEESPIERGGPIVDDRGGCWAVRFGAGRGRVAPGKSSAQPLPLVVGHLAGRCSGPRKETLGANS